MSNTEVVETDMPMKVPPTELSEAQSTLIGDLISQHANDSPGKTRMSEQDKLRLRQMLQSASDKLDFLTPPSRLTPYYLVPLTDFENLKEIMAITYNKEIRDIDSTPKILIEEGQTQPSLTLRLKAAIAIILSDAYNKPIDRMGKETKRVMLEIGKLARELVISIHLTLIEQGKVVDLKEAKTMTWIKVPVKIQLSYCYLLENIVFKSLEAPISRCKSMWVANHYLHRAMLSKS